MEIIREGYTRVSNILSIFQAYAFVPKDRLKKAQDIGTDVHEAIELYFSNQFSPLETSRTGYFDSFLKWVTLVKPTPILFEQRFYHEELKYTGRIDLLSQLNGKTWLVDFKTGSWAHPHIWNMQAHFYSEMLACNGVEKPKNFLFVQLRKDGQLPDLHEFFYSDNHWGMCKKAVDLYSYFNGQVAQK